MSTEAVLEFEEEHAQPEPSIARRIRRKLQSPWASAVAIIVAALWTIPTFGLLLSSFRPAKLIKTTGWWTFFTNPQLTLENYSEVLFGGASSQKLASYVLNSIVITIPGTIFPLVIAALAAYAFTAMKWKGRDAVFIGVFALQIVPLQMAFIPLLQLFSSWGIRDIAPFGALWISHTVFALPLAIFLLQNFMADIPGELIESARIDGAGHVQIFLRVMLPLLTPALASFAIFQFLWVWNDLLVALVFAGGTPDVAPLTARLNEMAGSRGNDWQRLTAGAFVSMVIPLCVFLGLQKYFVRGLLAGSVKG